ncbi:MULTISPECIES: hypothetical protein [Streptococcus]|uniref:Polymerase nucleotidyl transferase domain-containing protein n=2 Tax=Streptococcus lactarius TaxID=684066 RepID=A0ABX7XNC1_9STRE|nr:hypothetical protein [Streptococcus lactarius]QUB39777.1 hypothetical protein J4854_04855 [Streptococcus lactarius]
MNILCIIYDTTKESLLFSKSESGYYVPSQSFYSETYKADKVVDYLYLNYNLNLQELDFTEIFSNEENIILLANVQKPAISNGEWVPLYEIKDISIKNIELTLLKYIFNYFFRIDKFPKETLEIYLKCTNNSLLVKCKELIFERNPGMISSDRYDNLGIKIVDECGDSSEVIDLMPFEKDQNETLTFENIKKGDSFLEALYENVMEKISDLYSIRVSSNTLYLPSVFYGITGMTESGKSYYSKYIDLKEDFWNLKIRTFIESAKKLVDKSISSLLETVSIQQMIDFASYHYFKEAFVIESIYSRRFHEKMREILKYDYKLIYIEAPKNIREFRSLDSIVEFQTKDIKKEKLGISFLKSEADVVIDNSDTASNSKEQINKIFLTYKENNPILKPIRDFNVNEKLKDEMMNFFNFIVNNYQDKILLFSYTGSTTNNSYIEGWSDVDVLLVLEENIIDFYNEVNCQISKYSYKFGVNIITKGDIERDRVDTKNLLNLYNICRGYIKPNYIRNFKLPVLNIDKITNMQIVNRNNFISSIKKHIVQDSFNVRKVFKECLIVFMILLAENGKLCITYSEVVEGMREINHPLSEYLEDLISKIPNLTIEEVRELCQKVITNL